MKTQIRRGCFETNSSSTHSLQLVNGSMDDAYKYVRRHIAESYTDNDVSTFFDPSDYMDEIENSSPIRYDVNIKGIDFESGDECKNVYNIINNWMAKIQYIGMLLYSYKSKEAANRKYWDAFYEKWGHNSWNMHYDRNPEYMKDLDGAPDFYNSDTIKWFKDWVKNYMLSVKGIIVDTVNYNVDDEYVDDKEQYMSGEILNDHDKLIDQLNSFMQDGTIMIYIDAAYNPYAAPVTTVY